MKDIVENGDSNFLCNISGVCEAYKPEPNDKIAFCFFVEKN